MRGIKKYLNWNTLLAMFEANVDVAMDRLKDGKLLKILDEWGCFDEPKLGFFREILDVPTLVQQTRFHQHVTSKRIFHESEKHLMSHENSARQFRTEEFVRDISSEF